MGQTEKRILVVDDDDAIRALLFTVLRRRGFRVDTARNGVEALERCAQCRYSLVLLDLMMPRLTGYQVLERIDSWPPEKRPNIIVLTAGNEPRNLSADLVAGTVRKPFDIELLFDMVVACMLSRREADQMDSCPPAESDSAPAQNGSTKPN
jgi:CheY-like chemotaxis protein